ncbi:MAG: protease HtpX [Woeseiaceae bacterium]|jgi:heat shock protein HtpX|nr:protease HtpX [Woeseiaceae bacterium]
MFKRIALFLGTNIAVLVVLSVAVQLLGLEDVLRGTGSGLNVQGLLILSAVIGFAGSFISLFISKFAAKMTTRAKVIESPSNAAESWLVNTVQRQAQQAGIGMPEVAIYDSPEPNAFATGWNRNNALVAVSTGLLRGMKQDEVEAVLAHEITHVANGDMVTLTLIQGVVNTFVIFLSRIVGHFVDRVLLKNEGDGYGIGYFLTTIAAQIVFGILASTIVMWFSRQREFRADAGAASLAGRQKMIDALARLDNMHTGKNQLPEQIEAMGISGREGMGFKRFFMSHPPISERIAALQRSA